MRYPSGVSSGIDAPSSSREYLTFRLGGEEYGVPILAVQEIKERSPITSIPHAPRHLSGVMNLRGTIVPVIDLRVRLGLPDAASGLSGVIILVAIGPRIAGLIVDAVSDVLALPAPANQAAPDFGAEPEARFTSGLAQFGNRLVVLLDVARVVDS